MISALFVAKDGPYFNRLGIEPWGIDENAKLYQGPNPVIAHPPCERWGRYWSGGPSAKVRRKLGDDDGCFEFALKAVQTYGGVLEHPAHTHAYKAFGISRPITTGGWTKAYDGKGFVCHVEQGHYGHLARKATWLYFVGSKPRDLIWGPSTGIRMDEGFHSNEERHAARAALRKPLKRLSKRQRIHSPEKFVSVLISLVKESV